MWHPNKSIEENAESNFNCVGLAQEVSEGRMLITSLETRLVIFWQRNVGLLLLLLFWFFVCLFVWVDTSYRHQGKRAPQRRKCLSKDGLEAM